MDIFVLLLILTLDQYRSDGIHFVSSALVFVKRYYFQHLQTDIMIPQRDKSATVWLVYRVRIFLTEKEIIYLSFRSKPSVQSNRMDYFCISRKEIEKSVDESIN